MDGAVRLDQVKVIQDDPGVARDDGRPLVSPEVVVIATFPLNATGTDANVQVRGVSPDVFKVRKNVHIRRAGFSSRAFPNSSSAEMSRPPTPD